MASIRFIGCTCMMTLLIGCWPLPSGYLGMLNRIQHDMSEEQVHGVAGEPDAVLTLEQFADQLQGVALEEQMALRKYYSEPLWLPPDAGYRDYIMATVQAAIIYHSDSPVRPDGADWYRQQPFAEMEVWLYDRSRHDRQHADRSFAFIVGMAQTHVVFATRLYPWKPDRFWNQ